MFGCLSWGHTASAEHCAPVSPKGASAPWSVGWTLEAASYSNPRYTGTWEGIRPEVAGHEGAFAARAWLPAYRLERNGLAVTGLGDAGIEASVAAFKLESPALTLGPTVALTLPTGSDKKDLGMGHVMAMGGALVGMHVDAWRLGGSLSFARALVASGSGAHAHQHGSGPIVEPMNPSEIAAGGLLGFEFSTQVALESTLFAAWPVALPGGETRVSVGLMPVVSVGGVELRARLELPVLGDAFRLRGALGVEFEL